MGNAVRKNKVGHAWLPTERLDCAERTILQLYNSNTLIYCIMPGTHMVYTWYTHGIRYSYTRPKFSDLIFHLISNTKEI